MAKVSRRQLLIGLSGVALGGTFLTGCPPLSEILGGGKSDFEKWMELSRDWWKNRQVLRERERATAREAGKRPKVALPMPYMECGRETSSRGALGDQIKAIPFGEWGEVALVVKNNGNAPSWSCVVELYESIFDPENVLFSKMRRTDSKLFVFQPGERKEVLLRWRATRASRGSIVARCYDPLQDPCKLIYPPSDRKSSGFGWLTWGG
jgi:hypothetical protein